jgi:hypothetical protein
MPFGKWSLPTELNKRSKDSHIIQYVKNWNGYDGNPSLMIYRQDYAKIAWGDKPSEWHVEFDDGVSRHLGKFRTKSAAIKFAKHWMSFH